MENCQDDKGTLVAKTFNDKHVRTHVNMLVTSYKELDKVGILISLKSV